MTETREQKIERLETEIHIRLAELNELEQEAIREEVKALEKATGCKILPLAEQLDKIYSVLSKVHDRGLATTLKGSGKEKKE